MTAGDIFLGLLAIIFPPIAVWIKSGICSCDSLINILLCMLGYFPGLLHAWYIIAIYPEIDYDYEPIDDAERGQVTAYYVVATNDHHHGGSGNQSYGATNDHHHHHHHQHGGSGNQSYATANGQPAQTSSPAPPAVPDNTRPSQPSSSAEGSSDARPPPTYAEAVRGDNKIQTRD